MRIVRMDGGLGNQVFQYIFVRYLEEATGERVLVDDSHFFLVQDKVLKNREEKPSNNISGAHNGYELEYVFPGATKPLLLSQFLEPGIWRHMIEEMKRSESPETSIARQILANGIGDLTAVFEVVPEKISSSFTGNKIQSPANMYNSGTAKIDGNIYYYGYWINPGYLNAYKDIMFKDLAFRPIADAKNRHYERMILKSLSVGVHIRRGDFVTLNCVVPESYYRDIFAVLKSNLPQAAYFVFSDDMGWCRENAEQLGIPNKNTVFVEGNFDYKNNYIDAQLMAMCKILLVGTSSFSYLASLLNQREGFMAIQMRKPSIADAAENWNAAYHP